MMARILWRSSILFATPYPFSGQQKKLKNSQHNHTYTDLQQLDKFTEYSGSQKQETYSKAKQKDIQKIDNQLIEEQKRKYTVLQNYLLPARPRKILAIVDYMKILPEYSGLSRTELKIVESKLSPAKVNMYRKGYKIQNLEIEQKQGAYDRVHRIIKILPFYYHMLLAFTHNDAAATTKYAPQQLYEKMNRIHPYIRATVYKKYQQIHSLKEFRPIPSKQLLRFRNQADRLPILYIKHPYELYMIDQVDPTNQLAPQDYFSANEEQYEARFSQLPSHLQLQYRYNMHKIQISQQSRLLEIGQKRGIQVKSIQKLALSQFTNQNKRILREINIQQ